MLFLWGQVNVSINIMVKCIFCVFFCWLFLDPSLITKYSITYELYFLSHSKHILYLTAFFNTENSQRLEEQPWSESCPALPRAKVWGSGGGFMLFYGSCKGHTVPPGLAIVAHLRANFNSSWGDLAFLPNHSSTFKSQQSSRAETTVNPCRLSGFYPEKK